MEVKDSLPKNPLIVDLKAPGKQSTTKAWFSKVGKPDFI